MGGDNRWRAGLRDARKRLGITQRALAEQTGISFEAIRGYERGRRNAPRDRLETLIAALKIPNADANVIRDSAGYAPVTFLFAGEEYRDFFYTPEELPAAVEETPWPQFVVNDAFEVVAANAAICAVWDIDFAEEQRTRTRAQMNVLSVASDHHFADRLKNWDEVIAMFVSIFKAPSPTSYSLDAPTPYFNEVIAQFLNGDPAFLARLFKIWNETEPRKAKVRSSYQVVWEHLEVGIMRFRCIITNASYPDALSFNDWIPTDAETWNHLERLKARKSHLALSLAPKPCYHRPTQARARRYRRPAIAPAIHPPEKTENYNPMYLPRLKPAQYVTLFGTKTSLTQWKQRKLPDPTPIAIIRLQARFAAKRRTLPLAASGEGAGG